MTVSELSWSVITLFTKLIKVTISKNCSDHFSEIDWINKMTLLNLGLLFLRLWSKRKEVNLFYFLDINVSDIFCKICLKVFLLTLWPWNSNIKQWILQWIYTKSKAAYVKKNIYRKKVFVAPLLQFSVVWILLAF